MYTLTITTTKGATLVMGTYATIQKARKERKIFLWQTWWVARAEVAEAA